MWTTALFWQPATSPPTPTLQDRPRRCSINPSCCSSVCERSAARPLGPAQPALPIDPHRPVEFRSADMNLTMVVPFLSRLSRLITSVAAMLILTGAASQLHAQSIAVMVNGEPITHYDIEQRSKLNMLSHKAATRQQVIEELIDEKVKIKEAKKFGVDPTSSDIDAAFGQMSSRMHLTADQLTKSLEAQGIRPDTLKARIKADMVWGSLVRGRFKESLQAGEKDVAAAVQVNADEKDKPQTESFEYQMRPIQGEPAGRRKGRCRRRPGQCRPAGS